ncbi:MAG TPA: NADH-quinone oxidoreductase subunit J [Terriglobia bacterium]|nr:NADH-quinone oxidoreductase subunit J [Terriglobia bacterium]
MLELGTFIIFSVTALVSAVFVITRRNAVHSAIWLTVTLFAVSGIYLLQHAEFLFAVQIILYVGGIMVLFLFVVMLVDIDVALKQARFARQWQVALVTAILLLAIVGYALYNHGQGLNLPARPMVNAPAQNTQAVGMALYQNYMLPVEIASVLLLVAMVGAVIMAKRKLE